MRRTQCFPRSSRSESIGRPRIFVFAAILVSIYLTICDCGYADESLNQRESFLNDISTILFGSGMPLSLGDGLGWRGVVISPNGETLPRFRRLFEDARRRNQTRRGPSSRRDILETMRAFDKPLFVRDGIAGRLEIPITQIWQEVIFNARSGRPRLEVADCPSLSDSPSESQYDEYLSRIQAVTRSQLRKYSGEWRLDGRLSLFGSSGEALRTLNNDWRLFGVRDLVESSRACEMARFNDSAVLARQELKRAAEDEDFGPLCETYLFPSPEQWEEYPNWLSIQLTDASGEGAISFEVGRIQLIRPWFHIEKLLTGEIDSQAAAGEQGYSDGQPPTTLAYPKGRLSVYIEEILLVRQVRFTGKGRFDEHPLRNKFAYPAVVNLLGYVVRAMPDCFGTSQ
jgi:hypothetical protein